MIEAYAQAFFDAFKEQNCLDELFQEVSLLYELFDQNREFLQLLDYPGISLEQRQERLNSVLEGFNPLLLLLGKILLEDRQITHATEVLETLLSLMDREKGLEPIRIVSAIALSESQKERLIRRLENRLNHPVQVSFETSPDVVGGIRIIRQDQVIDYTVPGRLDQIRQILKN